MLDPGRNVGNDIENMFCVKYKTFKRNFKRNILLLLIIVNVASFVNSRSTERAIISIENYCLLNFMEHPVLNGGHIDIDENFLARIIAKRKKV